MKWKYILKHRIPQLYAGTVYQGDQIEWIIINLVIFHFEKFFVNYRRSPDFWATFSTVKCMS
jgi:hypothetical protein